MQFRILGSLEAVAGGATADLGPPKQRALLAILLLHVGEIVSIDRLIDALWPEQPPRTAAHSIQIYVSELRKALAPLDAGEHIVTRQPGYQLLAAQDSIDAGQFERLVDEGLQQLHGGDRAGGTILLRSALALWRGPALSDFAYEEFAQPYIRRLTDRHLDTIEELATAELDAGLVPEALSLVGAAIREDPLRERSREILMLALYRSGRHAEALRTYQRLRDLLADELGLDPSPALQRLQERILLRDPTLAPAVDAPPRAVARAMNPYKGRRGLLRPRRAGRTAPRRAPCRQPADRAGGAVGVGEVERRSRRPDPAPAGRCHRRFRPVADRDHRPRGEPPPRRRGRAGRTWAG